jgi:hypothetical protein
MNNPMLEEASIKGAKHILVNVVAGLDFSPVEIEEIVNLVSASADPDVMIKNGWVIDESMGDSVQVTVVATGFNDGSVKSISADDDKQKIKSNDYLFDSSEWDKLTGIGTDKFLSEKFTAEKPLTGFREDDLDVPTILRSGRPNIVIDPNKFRKQA